MVRLADLRISTKVMLVVALLSAIAAGIAAISIRSLNTMNTVADRMNTASDTAVAAIRLNTPVLAISAAVFRTTAVPTPATRDEAQKAIAEEKGLFAERLAATEKGPRPI